MGVRRKGREFALQMLYLVDVTKLPAEKIVDGVTAGENLDEKSVAFARDLAFGALNNKTALDELIKKYAKNWEMERMAALDRNILRMGAYEIVYQTDTPVSVIIDEAVEIAKTFSTPDSGKFVNGILDKIKLERKSDDPKKNGKSKSEPES